MIRPAIRSLTKKAKILVAILLIFFGNLYAQDNPPLKLVQKISLLNVKGRIDHLAVDLKGKRLFIAALGNNTLEVVDLQTGRQVHTIAGLSEPQGVIFVSDSNKIYVSNGGNGKCDIFDSTTFNPVNDVSFNDDADNMHYDSLNHKIYVGYGSGGIGVIDSLSGKKVDRIKLSAHPEAFELERKGDRIFVNIPAIKQIAVVNRKNMAIEAHWRLKDTSGNFPMALDEATQRLFVACRNPAKLLVFDTQSGKIADEQAIDGDADDIFYDAKNKHIYISCGEGFIDILQQQGSSNYNTLERIPTATGARTSLFVPETGIIYLAVPARQGEKAQIWIYETR